MRKTTVCLIAILMCAWVGSFGQNNGLPQWKVIKEFHVIAASYAILPQTIFIPADDAVYRLSVVMNSSLPQQQGPGDYDFQISWTRRTGDADGWHLDMCFIDTFSCANQQTINALVFTVKPNTPVTFLVKPTNPPENSTYDLEFNIEKLTR